MNRDILGIEEYRGHIFENISKIIINQNYIENNFEFFDKILFKLWENYRTSTIEPISINKQMGLLEIFLSAMLEFKPSQELPEDTI